MALMVGLEGISITLHGAFNPSIVHPQWLRQNQLISQKELDDALERSQTERDLATFVVSPDATVFSVAGFGFIVEREKFQIETQDVSAAEPLKDLIMGILGVLAHTPVKALLFVRNLHFQMANEGDWNRVGHHLVPKEPWNGILENPGTKTVRVQGTRRGADSKRVQIVVEPSKPLKYGVFVGVGELFELKDGAAEAIGILRADWTESQRYARSSAENIVQECLK